MLAWAAEVGRPHHNSVGLGGCPDQNSGRCFCQLRFLIGVGDGAECIEEFVELGVAGLQAGSFEGSVFEIGTGGLESVEDESGVAMIDAAVEEGFDGFHDGDLDGIGVFEQGEFEGVFAREGLAGIATGVGAKTALGLVVEVAETTVFERGTAAEFSVGLDVLAKWYRGHDPSPLPILWNQRVRLEMRVNFNIFR